MASRKPPRRSETIFPTLEEALYVHEQLLARFGGAPGVRDPGLLESALVRPRSGFYETLSEQGAALMQSLARNHSFIDGNKRMAFAMAAIFLSVNGYRLVVDADAAEAFLIDGVIRGHADMDEMTGWLERFMVRAS